MVCPSPPHCSVVCQVSFKKWRSADSCIPIKQMCQPQLEHCGNDLQCKRSIADQMIAIAHSLYYYLCAVARICCVTRSSWSDRVKSAMARAELHFTAVPKSTRTRSFERSASQTMADTSPQDLASQLIASPLFRSMLVTE